MGLFGGGLRLFPGVDLRQLGVVDCHEAVEQALHIVFHVKLPPWIKRHLIVKMERFVVQSGVLVFLCSDWNYNDRQGKLHSISCSLHQHWKAKQDFISFLLLPGKRRPRFKKAASKQRSRRLAAPARPWIFEKWSPNTYAHPGFSFACFYKILSWFSIGNRWFNRTTEGESVVK